jgi:hypothetical protein
MGRKPRRPQEISRRIEASWRVPLGAAHGACKMTRTETYGPYEKPYERAGPNQGGLR